MQAQTVVSRLCVRYNRKVDRNSLVLVKFSGVATAQTRVPHVSKGPMSTAWNLFCRVTLGSGPSHRCIACTAKSRFPKSLHTANSGPDRNVMGTGREAVLES